MRKIARQCSPVLRCFGACVLAATLTLLGCAVSEDVADGGSGWLTYDERPAYDALSLSYEIHREVNESRASNGLPRLDYDDALAEIARRHSADMAARGYFSHTRLDGATPTDRASELGYECEQQVGDVVLEGVSENLFSTSLWHRQRSESTEAGPVRFYEWLSSRALAEATVRAWLESPGHRTNLLKDTHRVEGIGVAIDDDDRMIVTQLFC